MVGSGGVRGMLDLFFIIIILVAFGVAVLVFWIVSDAFNEQAGPLLDNPTSTTALEKSRTAIEGFDYIYAVVLVMLIVFVVVSAVFIRSHPVFFFVSLILLVILILVAQVLTNTYEDLTASGAMNESASHFPIMQSFNSRLPLVALVAGVLFFLALFAKPWQRSGDVV